MSSVGCPRCDEQFRVPDTTLPKGLRLRCPWCNEVFSLGEIGRNLPPMVQFLSDDGDVVSLQAVIGAGVGASLGASDATSLPSAMLSAAPDLFERVDHDDPRTTLRMDETVRIERDNISGFDTSQLEDGQFEDGQSNERGDFDPQYQADQDANADGYLQFDERNDFDDDPGFSGEPGLDDEYYDPRYEDGEIEDSVERVPVSGPVPPRPLPTPKSLNLEVDRLSARPRAKKQSSPIKSMVGIVIGGLLSIPLAGLVLTLFGQKPDWGFYPFDGKPSVKFAVNEPMKSTRVQRPGLSEDTLQSDRMPADTAGPADPEPAPADAPGYSADDLSDSAATEANTFASDSMAPATDEPGSSTDGDSSPPTDSLANLEIPDLENSLDAIPVPVPAEVNVPDSMAIPQPDPVPNQPVVGGPEPDNGFNDIILGDTGSGLVMPSELTDDSAIVPPVGLIAPQVDPIAPQVDPIATPTFTQPASPELFDAISNARWALEQVRSFPKSGDAAALKKLKEKLYTSIAEVGLLNQESDQPETTSLIDEVAEAGMMKLMTTDVAPIWLRYAGRTHNGLFAAGTLVQTGGDWTLKTTTSRGDVVITLRDFPGADFVDGDTVVVLAKIIDATPPATIQVNYANRL